MISVFLWGKPRWVQYLVVAAVVILLVLEVGWEVPACGEPAP